MTIPFTKMHGLGNDFVVLDEAQIGARHWAADVLKRLADRHYGVGCDQIILLSERRNDRLDVRFFNADGSTAGMCGNGLRCVSKYLDDAGEGTIFVADTGSREVTLTAEKGVYVVAMGRPVFTAAEIPCTAENPLAVEVGIASIPCGCAVSMGNPHVVFVVPDVAAVPLAEWGPLIEHHALFPDRVNVEFVAWLDEATVRMRVWERGAGVTQACGSGACAVAAALQQAGFNGNQLRVILDGGPLDILFEDDNLLLSGAATTVFKGVWTDVVDLT